MRCPKCANVENKVIDSRMNTNGEVIRRRRECLSCTERFTTYERLERTQIFVVKKDGRREEFDRNKILDGIRKACQKRPVSLEAIEELVDRIEKNLQDSGNKEISAMNVGESVVRELAQLDGVAYVRFASVYREFKDVNEFMSELKDILKNKDS